jgi:hypothetical protein
MTVNKLESNIESRITPVFARDIRRRLEARHAKGTAIRRVLDEMTDSQIAEAWLRHHRQEIAHVAQKARRNV